MGRKTEVPKNLCQKCNKFKDKNRAFYNCNSPMFNGKSPICKDCLKSMIGYDDMQTVYATLQQLDTMFDAHYWSIAVQSDMDTLGKYMTMANSLPYFNGRSWKDSQFQQKNLTEVVTVDPSKPIVNIRKDEFLVTDEILDKWGEGYSPEHYRLFEKKYNRLIRNYGQKTELHTEGLITYIRFRVQEEMASARNESKDAKQWAELASKAAQDAKINVSQLSKSDISGGVDVLSQLFEAVETEVSVIPLLPKLLEQPYDDVDMVIWATVNYNRILEDKSRVEYKEIWDFYDVMLSEYFASQGFNEEQVENFKRQRNNVFRDLAHVYVEPLYDESDSDEL